MEILIGWVVFSAVAGIVAAARNRSGTGYFLLSLMLSPLIGLLLAALLPNPGTPEERAEAEAPRMRCSSCAELVMAAAMKCKHCGADLQAQRDASTRQQREEAARHEETLRRQRMNRAEIGRGVGAALARMVRRK